MLLSFYFFMIFISIVLTWVSADPRNVIVRFIYHTTEPVLSLLRARLPNLNGIEYSGLVALFLIVFLQAFLVKSINDYGLKLAMQGVKASSEIRVN